MAVNTPLLLFLIFRVISRFYFSNRYRGRCDAIQFCVDKRVFIVGFGLYGSSNGSSDYSARIGKCRALAGNLKLGGLEIFFQRVTGGDFLKITVYKKW